MPTARELLEQADALMRRNRAREAPLPEAPVVVEEAVPEPIESAAGPAASVDSSPRREALANDLREPPSDAYPFPPTPSNITTLDDIPELTDVVEEIEAPSILDLAGDFDLGEPSVFMEPGHGEVSILGPWPEPAPAQRQEGGDGLEAVATPGSEAVETGEGEVGVLHIAPEWLADEDVVERLPVEIDSPVAKTEWVDDGIAVAAEPPQAVVGLAENDIAETDVAETGVAETDVAETDVAETDVAETDVAETDIAETDIAETDIAETDIAETDIAETDDVTNTPALVHPAEEAPEGVSSTGTPDFGPALSVTGPDQAPGTAAKDVPEARWDQIAEEIRMQVLQRIDIFTDTGLQDQLAARLQPIVDRASDELVSTINQHVGQLLRAYVAEAIEREIQQWRAGDHS